MFFTPLPVRQAVRGLSYSVVCSLEKEADIKVRILAFDSEHLTSCSRVKIALALNKHSISKVEVWDVPGRRIVTDNGCLRLVNQLSLTCIFVHSLLEFTAKLHRVTSGTSGSRTTVVKNRGPEL